MNTTLNTIAFNALAGDRPLVVPWLVVTIVETIEEVFTVDSKMTTLKA